MTTDSSRLSATAVALVVEDDPTCLFLILRFLQKYHIMCHVAENGAQCLDLVENFEYDLIVIDCILPDVHASEVVRRLRGGGMSQRAKLVGISADSTSANRQAMADAGCEDFWVKPIDWKVAHETLVRLLPQEGTR